MVAIVSHILRSSLLLVALRRRNSSSFLYLQAFCHATGLDQLSSRHQDFEHRPASGLLADFLDAELTVFQLFFTRRASTRCHFALASSAQTALANGRQPQRYTRLSVYSQKSRSEILYGEGPVLHPPASPSAGHGTPYHLSCAGAPIKEVIQSLPSAALHSPRCSCSSCDWRHVRYVPFDNFPLDPFRSHGYTRWTLRQQPRLLTDVDERVVQSLHGHLAIGRLLHPQSQPCTNLVSLSALYPAGCSSTRAP